MARKVKKQKKKSGCLTNVIVAFLFLALLGSCTGGGSTDSVTPTETTITIETIAETTAAVTEATTEPATEPTTIPTTVPETTEPIPETTIPATTEAPAPVETEAAQQEPAEEMVWVPTGGGKRYHSREGCSNMKSPEYITISQAKARGFTACGRCY